MENKNISGVDINDIESPYVQDNDCIDRYLETIERDGYQVTRTKYEITFERDKTTTIRFQTIQELEMKVRRFMRNLPQSTDE